MRNFVWVVYFALVIFTYGHAYNNEQINYDDERLKGMGVLFTSIGFPFYWSTEFQRKVK